MKLIRSLSGLGREIRSIQSQAKSIGFVPTMGALHVGHAALIRSARRECDRVVVSIFVNPIQFGPREDFKRYPRDRGRDLAFCRKEAVDLVFAPDAPSIYPEGFQTFVEVGELAERLCGLSRPSHFRGVATVCAKLFNLIRPDRAYFGKKDYQQLLIIERMVRDLHLEVEIRPVETVREKDGLAVSSRNRYLSFEERKRATSLYRSLLEGKSGILQGERDPKKVVAGMKRHLRTQVTRIDYVEILDADNLRPMAPLKGKIVIALACFLGETRLIDNVTLRV